MSDLQSDADIPPSTHPKTGLRFNLFCDGCDNNFRPARPWRDSIRASECACGSKSFPMFPAAFLFAFGLHFLGILRIPLLYREARVELKSNDASTACGQLPDGAGFWFWLDAMCWAGACCDPNGCGWYGRRDAGRIAAVGLWHVDDAAGLLLLAIFAKPFLRWMPAQS